MEGLEILFGTMDGKMRAELADVEFHVSKDVGYLQNSVELVVGVEGLKTYPEEEVWVDLVASVAHDNYYNLRIVLTI